MHVGVLCLELGVGQLGNIHVETFTPRVVTLEVTDALKRGRLGRVSDNAGSAVGDTASSSGLVGTRGTALFGSVGAELGGSSAEPKAVAAGLERTGVETGEIPAGLCALGLAGSGLERTTDGACDGVGHGILSGAEAHTLSNLETVAALPAPGVLVVVLDVGLGDVVGLGQGVARVTISDGVDEAGSIALGLGASVREGSGVTANELLHGEVGAEVGLGVELVQVGAGDSTALGERSTAVSGLDLDSTALGAGSEVVVHAYHAGAELDRVTALLGLCGGEDAEVDGLLGALAIRRGDAFSFGP